MEPFTIFINYDNGTDTVIVWQKCFANQILNINFMKYSNMPSDVEILKVPIKLSKIFEMYCVILN